MKILVVVTLLTFLFYYFASLEAEKSNKQYLYIVFFVTSSVILRIILDVSVNNDYYLYYNFMIFHEPNSLLSYLINEPYLYSIYSICNSFLESKEDVFLGMYYFNFIINTTFFVWILTRADVEAFKKIVLFTLHYFIFGFVVLRNGPSYILFAMFFYYGLRGIKFKWVLLTPLMHISSCIILVTYFYKSKLYYNITIILPAILFFFFFFFDRYLITIEAFNSILSKIDYYSKGMEVIGLAHILFFIFICCLILLGIIFYKKKMVHPFLVTTIFIYIISFFVNPAVAYRFTPYLFFALLLAPFSTTENKKSIIIYNRSSVLLFPIFLYTLFLTHKNGLFLQFST